MNLSFLFGLPLLLVGCATYLTKDGSNVYIEVVDKSTMAVEAAQKKFESQGCKFIQKVQAPIATGESHEYGRLAIGLKNKAAEVGGNAVISSMQPYYGWPEFTRGIVYSCPKSLNADGV